MALGYRASYRSKLTFCIQGVSRRCDIENQRCDGLFVTRMTRNVMSYCRR